MYLAQRTAHTPHTKSHMNELVIRQLSNVMKLLHAKGQIEDVCSITIYVRVLTLLLRIGEYKYPVLVIPDTMESITVQATMEMALSSQSRTFH